MWVTRGARWGLGGCPGGWGGSCSARASSSPLQARGGGRNRPWHPRNAPGVTPGGLRCPSNLRAPAHGGGRCAPGWERALTPWCSFLLVTRPRPTPALSAHPLARGGGPGVPLAAQQARAALPAGRLGGRTAHPRLLRPPHPARSLLGRQRKQPGSPPAAPFPRRVEEQREAGRRSSGSRWARAAARQLSRRPLARPAMPPGLQPPPRQSRRGVAAPRFRGSGQSAAWGLAADRRSAAAAALGCARQRVSNFRLMLFADYCLLLVFIPPVLSKGSFCPLPVPAPAGCRNRPCPVPGAVLVAARRRCQRRLPAACPARAPSGARLGKPPQSRDLPVP